MIEKNKEAVSMDQPILASQKPDVINIVQSLMGAVPYTNLSVCEIRGERLNKYDAVHDTSVIQHT